MPVFSFLGYVCVMKALLVLAALLAFPVMADAENALSAEAIVRKATDLGQPDASKQKTKMTLVDAKGGERTRALEVLRAKGEGGQWSTRLEFLEPKDVAGTVLLSVEKDGRVSQHLYLPGVKRVRKLVGKQRGGAFMGSDFTYEDLAPRDIGKSEYTLLPDETIGGKACWVVEAKPSKGADTSYAKSILAIAKDDFLTVRVRFFDAKGETKVLDVDPSKVHVEGDVRIPKRMEMTSKKDGHKTVIEVESIDLSPKVDPSAFDPSSLDRG